MDEIGVSGVQELTKIAIFSDGRLAFSNVGSDWLDFMGRFDPADPSVRRMQALRGESRRHSEEKGTLRCRPPKKSRS